jgi:hypothetical protein
MWMLPPEVGSVTQGVGCLWVLVMHEGNRKRYQPLHAHLRDNLSQGTIKNVNDHRFVFLPLNGFYKVFHNSAHTTATVSCTVYKSWRESTILCFA